MREWGHDELHELIDSSESLRQKSDTIHSLAPTDSLHGNRERKVTMIEIFAEAVGCKHAESAVRSVWEVFNYIAEHCSSWTEWKKAASSDETLLDAIDALSTSYSARCLCHSSEGNNYICYCNKDPI